MLGNKGHSHEVLIQCNWHLHLQQSKNWGEYSVQVLI